VRKLDNIQVAITPYQMTPLHKVTNQVLQQMQSFNEYNEHHHNNNVSSGPPEANILG
jgi:hypothetical protein